MNCDNTLPILVVFRGTDKLLFGVFKQINLEKKQLFSNEGVTKSNLILEKAIVF